MVYTDTHFAFSEGRICYAVTTEHGGYDSFHTLEAARNHANRVMIGYLEGLTCANDPRPTIIKIQEIEMLGFNKDAKTVFKRSGGVSFGSYRDHDCYTEVGA